MISRLTIAIGFAVSVSVLLATFFKTRKMGQDCSAAAAEKSSKTLKNPELTLFLPLISKEEITSSIRKFRFALPSPDDILGLPVGQHIQLTATINGEEVSRSYTPISSDADRGFVELIVKVFRSDERATLSQFLDEMRIGEAIAIRGPCGKSRYLGGGCFSIELKPGHPPKLETRKKMNMIAFDGGICQMMQITKSVLADPRDKTKINLIYFSDCDKHIMLKEELDKLAIKHPGQLRISYIGEENLLGTIFNPSEDVITLVCPVERQKHNR